MLTILLLPRVANPVGWVMWGGPGKLVCAPTRGGREHIQSISLECEVWTHFSVYLLLSLFSSYPHLSHHPSNVDSGTVFELMLYCVQICSLLSYKSLWLGMCSGLVCTRWLGTGYSTGLQYGIFVTYGGPLPIWAGFKPVSQFGSVSLPSPFHPHPVHSLGKLPLAGTSNSNQHSRTPISGESYFPDQTWL